MRTLSGTGEDDPVKDLVSAACEVAGVAHWLNDAAGLRLAGDYLTRAATMISEERLVEVMREHPTAQPLPPRLLIHKFSDTDDEDQAFERFHDRDLDA